MAQKTIVDEECKTKLQEFISELGNVLIENNFVELGQKYTQPPFEKCNSLITEDKVLLWPQNAFQSCKVFDIPYLKPWPSHETLFCLIDKLVQFESPEFALEFLLSLKKEVPELLNLSTSLPLPSFEF